MNKILKLSSNNLTVESIEKIYKMRFETYNDKFISSDIPSIDEHIIFIYRQLSNKNCTWFGLYDFIDLFSFPSLIGISCLYNHDKENSSIEFGRLMIEPSSISNGFATELIKHCINYAKKELLCKEVFLYVRKNNRKAIDIYERQGFTLVKSDINLLYKINI